MTMMTCDHLLLLLLSPPWLENHVLDLSLSLLDIVSHLLCITISVLAVQAVLFIYIAISSCAALSFLVFPKIRKSNPEESSPSGKFTFSIYVKMLELINLRHLFKNWNIPSLPRLFAT